METTPPGVYCLVTGGNGGWKPACSLTNPAVITQNLRRSLDAGRNLPDKPSLPCSVIIERFRIEGKGIRH